MGLLMRLAVLPGLRVLLRHLPLNLTQNAPDLFPQPTNVVLSPMPVSPAVPNNPAIEDDRVEAFIKAEVIWGASDPCGFADGSALPSSLGRGSAKASGMPSRGRGAGRTCSGGMHPFMREMTGRSVVAEVCNGLSRPTRPVPCGSPVRLWRPTSPEAALGDAIPISA